ncbi:MAG: hypothetical protein ACREE9_11025 [Stellaceae bacterium]
MRSRLFAALLGAVVLAAGAAQADDPASALITTAPRVFKICTSQTYALCAVASCFVLDGLSYCKCDVKSGDSISLPFKFGRNQNVCTVNAEGKKNGYMVSTYSLPPSVVAPYGDQALYDCPAGSSNGAYAQCDGGVCFTSSKSQSFPGFAKPLAKDQIICSCPVTLATPQNSPAGYQIAGPYPCERSFFANCKKAVANTNTGATIYVGAPTGVPRLLTRRLYGRVPPINECRLPPWP